MLPISLMKGDEVVERGEKLSDSTLFNSIGGNDKLRFKEVGWCYVEQSMIPRTFCCNSLDALIPAVGLVVRNEKLRIDTQCLKNDVKGRYAALFISFEALYSTPWAIGRRALVIGKLASLQEVVATQISARYTVVEELSLVY